MADRLHIPTWNRTKKPLAIALSGVGGGWGGETMGTVQIMYKISLIGIVTTNPSHNEYTLIKIY
jgi:hypothetical protein